MKVFSTALALNPFPILDSHHLINRDKAPTDSCKANNEINIPAFQALQLYVDPWHSFKGHQLPLSVVPFRNCIICLVDINGTFHDGFGAVHLGTQCTSKPCEVTKSHKRNVCSQDVQELVVRQRRWSVLARWGLNSQGSTPRKVNPPNITWNPEAEQLAIFALLSRRSMCNNTFGCRFSGLIWKLSRFRLRITTCYNQRKEEIWAEHENPSAPPHPWSCTKVACKHRYPKARNNLNLQNWQDFKVVLCTFQNSEVVYL